jgi:hypothetical protein
MTCGAFQYRFEQAANIQLAVFLRKDRLIPDHAVQEV